MNNEELLKRQNKILYKKYITAIENGLEPYKSIETKNGYKTIKVPAGDKDLLIHSKYDPIREAEALYDEFADQIKEYDQIFFYGLGLGYHVEKFLKEHPSLSYSTYEPDMKVFISHMEARSLTYLSLDRLVIDTDNNSLQLWLNRFLKESSKKTLLIILPSYKQALPESVELFSQSFKKALKNVKNEFITNKKFENRWLINSIKNYCELLKTPNILTNKYKQKFKDKPVILVAAGPSLNDELDQLIKIKKDETAYIFAVGSANRTLIKHNILPDAVLSYDPQAHNHKVYEEIITENIKEVPLIFGSSVGHETVQKFPGQKLHMITSADTVSAYFMKNQTKEYGIVNDSPTIALITLQVLYYLQCDPVILVGQNLAFRNNEFYSSGVKYEKRGSEVQERDKRDEILVESVEGEMIQTNDSFDRMRHAIEQMLFHFQEQGRTVINTTKGGANISYTVFQDLNSVMLNELKEPVVDKEWIDTPDYENKYSIELVEDKRRRLLRKKDECYSLLLEIIKTITQISTNKEHRLYQKMYKGFGKFDKYMKKLQQNDYYLYFIKPYLRVEFQNVLRNEYKLTEEQDYQKKADALTDTIKPFIERCLETDEILSPYIDEMEDQIQQETKQV
ncbi:DUF115 domain-containing protein [Salibacterium salarium]|uniref:DUF115 domain-containing protein n=1 Tax=Salibacterium salarium TaxID=284579 RepID=A0A428N9Q2_9BACI|nr:6-hydroxymethylpterin diphosphokinase MptE-like protein [Salibacterium salarium]RSL35117.1 DUF115 domain-containing protein [Salibacterium salarium]